MTSGRHTGPEPAPRGWARVRLAQGRSHGEIWDVTDADAGVRLDVGSHDGCSWRIDSPGVAPYQLVFFWDGQVLWASDLHGSGGARVDGEPLADWRALTGRVRVEFGEAALIVETSAAAIYDESTLEADDEPETLEPQAAPVSLHGGTGEHPAPEAPTRVVHSGERPPQEPAGATRVVRGAERAPQAGRARQHAAPTRVAGGGPTAVFGGAAGDRDVPSDPDGTRVAQPSSPAPPAASPVATRMAQVPEQGGPIAERAPMPQAGAGAQRVDTTSHVMPEYQGGGAAPPASAPSPAAAAPSPPPAAQPAPPPQAGPPQPAQQPAPPPQVSPPPPPPAPFAQAAQAPQPSPSQAPGAPQAPQAPPSQGGAPSQQAAPPQAPPGAAAPQPAFAAPPTADGSQGPPKGAKEKAKRVLTKGNQSLPMRTWLLLAMTVGAFVYLVLMDEGAPAARQASRQGKPTQQAAAAEGEPKQGGDEARADDGSGEEGSADEDAQEDEDAQKKADGAEDADGNSETEPAPDPEPRRADRRRGRRGDDEPEVTAERRAVDLLMAGHHERALEAYRALAEAHPDRPEIGAVVKILSDRAGSGECTDGVDEMGRPCEPADAPDPEGDE